MNEFDIKAKSWDENPLNIERAKAIADIIKEKISFTGNEKALDYGCGTGLLSMNLFNDLKNIILADTSTRMLEVVNEKIRNNAIKNMTAIDADLNSEALSENNFNIIYTSMTLHHIEDVEGSLRKFYSLLKPEGQLCIADLDSEDGTFHDDSFTGHFGFDRGDLKIKTLNAGFNEVLFYDCFTINKINSQGQKQSYTMFLMIAQK
ncbi:MAG: hypothetical protein A2275_01160 [Bacteroidetes bacterium RIFOXYA12_FULL_35_11]|nr:MAG: hypothetical protein A2X01_03995 [Bacteroidetes bacterium GWF2_35_48]OFY78426.1 MAG: hypothetical protein A2275_01160 [Bacteroidetes bacterium RIFOXYA12_FULL_35_11]OFY93483.1 MAG: hypothetical protein A2491_10880 [Bacteroidetes bacterium RIFOXYC12_FULL_35_7]HBX50856.1 class I SAM-dependent methyltransferase [Bacteroidales bacterium]